MLSVLGMWWVAGAGVAGLAGVWLLWRGRHYRTAVSSVRLWEGLVGESGGSKARAIDPVWALILAAAVLAILAPGQVRLRTQRGEDRPWADCDVALRAAAGSPTAQLWVRLRDGGRLPAACALRWVQEERSAERTVTLPELRAGFLWDVPRAEHALVELRAPGQSDAVARAEVRQLGGKGFGVVEAGPVDQALGRVVAIQRGALRGDPGAGPVVWLVDDPNFSVDRVRPATGTWVVASPRTPLPGVKRVSSVQFPASREAGDAGWQPKVVGAGGWWEGIRVGAAGELGEARVLRYEAAELSAEWTILATVEDRPWLARRRDAGTGVGILWLASRMVPAETNWPVDPSFVVFFTHLIRETQPAGSVPAPGREAEAWTVRGLEAAAPQEPGYLDLTRGLAAAAAVLALLGMGLLVRRAAG